MHKNKITIAVLTSIFTLSGCNAQNEGKEITENSKKNMVSQSPVYFQDLSVFKVNTEEPKATFIPYDTADKVSADDYASSPQIGRAHV